MYSIHDLIIHLIYIFLILKYFVLLFYYRCIILFFFKLINFNFVIKSEDDANATCFERFNLSHQKSRATIVKAETCCYSDMTLLLLSCGNMSFWRRNIKSFNTYCISSLFMIHLRGFFPWYYFWIIVSVRYTVIFLKKWLYSLPVEWI